MSLEENKAVVRKAIETVNKQDLSLVDDLVVPNYFDHTTQQDLKQHKQFLAMLFKGFPDFHGTIEDIIAEGDKVWAHITFTGTHTGEWNFFGTILAPTGKQVTYKSVTIKRVVDGKMVEGWTVNDMLNFLRQLGVIEYTEKGKKLFPEDVT